MSLQDIRNNFRVSRTRTIKKNIEEVYALLSRPEERGKWNTQYVVQNKLNRPVKAGDTITVSGESIGTKTLTYLHVKPNIEFSLHHKLKLFNLIPLGDLYYTNGVEPAGNYTEVTQIIIFQPLLLGKPFKKLICKHFKTHINNTFTDLEAYVERENYSVVF